MAPPTTGGMFNPLYLLVPTYQHVWRNRRLDLTNSDIASRCLAMREHKSPSTRRQYVGAICKLFAGDGAVVKALTPYYDKHREGREALFNCSTFHKVYPVDLGG